MYSNLSINFVKTRSCVFLFSDVDSASKKHLISIGWKTKNKLIKHKWINKIFWQFTDVELRKASGWRVTRSGLQLVWKTDWNKARLFEEKLMLRGWPSDTRKRWLQTRLEVVEFWEIFRRWNYQDLMTDWLWGLTENSGFRLSNGMDVLIGKKW